MHKAYSKKVKLAADSEEVSMNMLKNISAVWTLALKHEDIFACVQETEKRRGRNTVFGSALQIAMIASKTPNKRLEDIRWGFASLADQARAGIAAGATYSMVDIGQKPGNRTIQQLLCLKKELKELCERSFIAAMGSRMDQNWKLLC